MRGRASLATEQREEKDEPPRTATTRNTFVVLMNEET